MLFPHRKSSLANSLSSTSPSTLQSRTPSSAASRASSATTDLDVITISKQGHELYPAITDDENPQHAPGKPSLDSSPVFSLSETSWFDDDNNDNYNSRSESPLSFEDEYSNESHCSSSMIDSCQFDNNDWFANFRTDIDISDEAPQDEALLRAAEIPVFDSTGLSRPFGSLCSSSTASPHEVSDRQLVIFIRHFFCGVSDSGGEQNAAQWLTNTQACRAYILRIVEQINLQAFYSMPIPTQIIIIGCGSPKLIKQYKAATSCPFPIFADPTRQLFRLLGMNISFNMLGKSRPEYMRDINAGQWIVEQSKFTIKAKGSTSLKFQGGNVFQIGGEFLFQDGRVVWCHRMRNYRGHAEVDTIKRVLGI